MSVQNRLSDAPALTDENGNYCEINEEDIVAVLTLIRSVEGLYGDKITSLRKLTRQLEVVEERLKAVTDER